MTATTGFAVANIRNSNIEGNTTGLNVTTNGFATVQDTRFAANSSNGVVTEFRRYGDSQGQHFLEQRYRD